MNLTFIHVLALAFVQSVAELLPVSSSAHVILLQHWLGFDPSHPQMVFLLVMLHLGTMFAVILYFRKTWLEHFAHHRRLWIQNCLWAMVATSILGLSLKELIEKYLLNHAPIESLFKNPIAVSAALFASGILICIAGFSQAKSSPSMKQNLTQPTTPMAVAIGAIQGLCLPFRGFSRSGATISLSLILGLSASVAEAFSFLLAVIVTPPVLVRSLYRLYSTPGLNENLSSTLLWGALGSLLAFLGALLALRLLHKFLETQRWWVFGIYCFFIGTVMLLTVHS